MNIFIVEMEERLEEFKFEIVSFGGAYTSIEDARMHIAQSAIDYISRHEDEHPNMRFALEPRKGFIFDKDIDEMLFVFTIREGKSSLKNRSITW